MNRVGKDGLIPDRLSSVCEILTILVQDTMGNCFIWRRLMYRENAELLHLLQFCFVSLKRLNQISYIAVCAFAERNSYWLVVLFNPS